MENLNDALSDLRTTIVEDGFRDGLVEQIASDWDLKAPLLARKFEEKYGKPADQYSALKQAEVAKLDDQLYSAKVQAAMDRAVREESRYSGGQVPNVLGKGFTADDYEFIAVVISTRGLVAVKVKDATIWRFGNGRSAYRAAQHHGLI